MQDLFVRNGGILMDNHQVIDTLPTSDEVTVVTNRGKFRGRKLILAPGSWGPLMLESLGVSVPLKVCTRSSNCCVFDIVLFLCHYCVISCDNIVTCMVILSSL